MELISKMSIFSGFFYNMPFLRNSAALYRIPWTYVPG